MKVYFLIKLALIQYICAELTLKQLENIEKTVTIQSRDNIVFRANPKSNLNLLIGYFYSKTEVDQKDGTLLVVNEVKNRLQKPSKEKDQLPYKQKVYPFDYQNALIYMFPSENKGVSIESSDPGAFTTFLRSEKMQKSKYYLLASLFLLSEGVDIPLQWRLDADQNTWRIQLPRKSSTRERYFFSVTANTYLENGEDIGVNALQEVTHFFITNKKVLEEPVTVEDLKERRFVYSPHFLIQTYLYKFIETEKEAGEFIKAVYDILCNLSKAEKKENLTKGQKKKEALATFYDFFVFDEYFKEVIDWNAVKKMDRILCEPPKTFYSVIPRNAPCFCNVPAYYFGDEEKSFFEQNGLTMVLKDLYVLFCALTYDRETKKYSMRKMPSASKSLKEFFKKYEDPGKKVNEREMWQEWSNIFTETALENTVQEEVESDNSYSIYSSDEETEDFRLVTKYMDIIYLKNTKVVKKDILKLLLIINEVTGNNMIYNVYYSLITFFKERKVIRKTDYEKLEKELETAFKAISIRKHIQVFCSDIKREYKPGQEPCIFGTVYVSYPVYTEDYEDYGICIPYSLNNSFNTELKTEIEPLSNYNAYLAIQDRFIRQKNFINNLALYHSTIAKEIIHERIDSDYQKETSRWKDAEKKNAEKNQDHKTKE